MVTCSFPPPGKGRSNNLLHEALPPLYSLFMGSLSLYPSSVNRIAASPGTGRQSLISAVFYSHGILFCLVWECLPKLPVSLREFLLLLKLWPNHSTKSCFQLSNLLTRENLGSNPSHMKDPYTLQFSLYWSHFPFLSRPNYFTECHLLWMRTWELPVQIMLVNSVPSYIHTSLRTCCLWESIGVTNRAIPDTVLCTYVSRQAAPILSYDLLFSTHLQKSNLFITQL